MKLHRRLSTVSGSLWNPFQLLFLVIAKYLDWHHNSAAFKKCQAADCIYFVFRSEPTLFSMFHHDCAEKYDYHDCNDYYCDCCFHPFFTSVLFFFRTGSSGLRMECYGRSVHCKYQSSFLRAACSFLSRAMQNSGQRIVRNVQGKSKSNKRRNRTVTISVPFSLPAAPRST